MERTEKNLELLSLISIITARAKMQQYELLLHSCIAMQDCSLDTFTKHCELLTFDLLFFSIYWSLVKRHVA